MTSDRTRIVFIALMVICALLPAMGQPYLVRLATQFVIYAIVAVSLDLLIGYGGLVSFGHAAFFGAGAYAAAYLATMGNASLLASLSFAFVVGIVLSAVVGALSLRVSGAYFIMVTLAFAQMMFYGSVVLNKFGGDEGVRVPRNLLLGLKLASPTVFFYVCLATFFLVLVFLSVEVRSPFGRSVRAIKDNPVRVRSLGYDSYRYQVVAFALAGGVAAIGGALHANLNEYASPSLFHWTLSGDFLVMVILGGVGSLIGPVLGTALFVALQAWLSTYTPLWMLWMAPILLAVVLFSNGGVRQLLERIPGGRRG